MWAKKFRWFWGKSCVILGLEEGGFERQEALRSECFGAQERRVVAGLRCQASHLPLQAGHWGLPGSSRFGAMSQSPQCVLGSLQVLRRWSMGFFRPENACQWILGPHHWDGLGGIYHCSQMHLFLFWGLFKN